jgi:hypothetical protein
MAVLGSLPVAVAEGLPWYVLLLAGITVLYVALIRPMMMRRKKDPLDRGPTFTPAQQRVVEREMQNLLVELSEMARQITSQLDTRARKLELLIDEADQRIALLGGASPSAVGEPAAPRPEPAPAPAQHADVYGLAEQGLEANDIARRLNRPRGEVELILALRRK